MSIYFIGFSMFLLMLDVQEDKADDKIRGIGNIRGNAALIL